MLISLFFLTESKIVKIMKEVEPLFKRKLIDVSKNADLTVSTMICFKSCYHKSLLKMYVITYIYDFMSFR